MSVSTRTRALVVTMAATLGATGLAVVIPGGAAVAAPHWQSAQSVQIGYTDSATPYTGYDRANNVNMPLGARLDEAGRLHKSRVYATFDLTPYLSKRIISATVTIQEVEAADCTKRSIEIWQTRTVQQTPSWARAPKGLVKLDEIHTPEYCPTTITFDVAAAVKYAVAMGKDRVTFELRVAKRHEADPAYGRKLNWYTSVGLSAQYNGPPALDDQHMYNGGFVCDTSAPARPLGWTAGSLQALASDPDQADANRLTVEFAVWPENDPSARKVYTSTYSFPGRVSRATVPEADYVDGRAYAWQYRAGDGADWTGWSKTCHLVIDRTPPAAPEVTSSNYPRSETGQATPLGEPGVFAFSGGGDPDVVGFEYGWEMIGVPTCGAGSGDVGQDECPDPFAAEGAVRADVPGGTATISISPDRITTNTLKVRSIDAAGNRSPETEYEIFAPWGGQPVVTEVGDADWNQPVTVRFSPSEGITGTTGFTFRLDFGPAQTIAAAADGTATFTFLASNEYGHQISVRSRSANGWVSPESEWHLHFYPTSTSGRSGLTIR